MNDDDYDFDSEVGQSLAVPGANVYTPMAPVVEIDDDVLVEDDCDDDVSLADNEDIGSHDVSNSSTKESVQGQSCVFMGPPNAGKTTLLGAMYQACMQPPRHEGDHHIKLLPNKSYARLLRQAHAFMYEGQRFDGTQQATPYNLTIRVTPPGGLWRASQPTEANLTVRDGPGGALFPREEERGGETARAPMARWEKLLLREAATAQTLVLCVDATQLDCWRVASTLPEVLGRIAGHSIKRVPEPHETWRQRLGRRWRSWAGHSTPRRAPEGSWLAADRFLLLLTKADELVAACGNVGPMSTPFELAETIDPVPQACALLGETAIYQILTALHPSASFAIGMTSAWGFDGRTGEVFRREAADSSATPAGAARRRNGTPSLIDWQPLGLRDAVIYMVSGHVGGCVRRVRAGMLHPDRRHKRQRSHGRSAYTTISRG